MTLFLQIFCRFTFLFIEQAFNLEAISRTNSPVQNQQISTEFYSQPYYEFLLSACVWASCSLKPVVVMYDWNFGGTPHVECPDPRMHYIQIIHWTIEDQGSWRLCCGISHNIFEDA
jgi:hypothetical protein